MAWRLEWYDHWLKGIDNSVGKSAPFATPVRIFVMGTGDGLKDSDGKLNHGGYWRDVLVFQTEPLEHDMEVTGEISVTLYASSSAKDTDFTAKLIDVYPPNPDFPGGFDMNIGDGIIRARFRDSLKEEKLMEPATLYEFTIKLYPTSNIFRKGHRIRIDISSSNYPRFDVNPNTGEPLNDHRRMITANNTVVHDQQLL